jgi:FkbM family methyltransferase
MSRDDVIPLRIPGLDRRLVMRVHQSTDVHVSRQIRSHGIWEAEETRLLMALLQPGHRFADVGANIGYFTLLGATLVGSAGKVYAFEPDPANCRLLRDNCALNQLENVQVEELALSDQSGDGQLYLSEDNLGDHTIYNVRGARREQRIQLVEGSRYFESAGETLDVIKIDVQGAEFQVLKGLESTLENSLPALRLVLEFSPNSLVAAGSDGEALLDLLLRLGLRFYIFDHRNQRLLACEPEVLRKWVNLTRMDPSSEGFINLVCSGESLEADEGLEIENNEDGTHDPLEYLLASHLREWDGQRCEIEQMGDYIFLSPGWSFPESWGVWSEGDESLLRFYPIPPEQDIEQVELCFEGQYYGTGGQTRVEVCGQSVGEFDLTQCTVRVPAGSFRGPDVKIRLRHNNPQSPRELEGVGDDRRIQYGLKALAWNAL